MPSLREVIEGVSVNVRDVLAKGIEQAFLAEYRIGAEEMRMGTHSPQTAWVIYAATSPAPPPGEGPRCERKRGLAQCTRDAEHEGRCCYAW